MDIGSQACRGGATYPASLAQARFWLLDALDPGSPALNVALLWTLLGPVRAEAAEAALQQIIGRHEILRTGLAEADGGPVQVVRAAVPFQLRRFDLTAMNVQEAAAAADRIGEAEARAPFCLDAPPLIRGALLAMGPDTHRLLLTLHHAVCDGWSAGILADEFLAALAGASRPPELPLQYGDFAEWQQAWLQSTALAADTAYWVKQLAALPYVAVPPDHPAEARGEGAIASVLLPRALTDEMAATGVRHGCTLFAVALAALGQVLQSRTGATDLAVGTQVAGRTEVELEGMIGPFINTVVVRLDLSGEPGWDTRISRAAGVVEAALHHHAMPFEVLVRTLNPPRAPGRTPLFSVNFIFQRSFVTPKPRGGVTLLDMPSHSAGALYDLNFFMVERADGWRASCEYDTARFERATVEAMLAEWRLAMAGKPVEAVADPVTDRLRAIWCEVLGVGAVAPEDRFFELGGHSLLAARMLARVEAVFGRRVGMAWLFEDDSLDGMAALLRGEDAGGRLLEQGGRGRRFWGWRF